MQKYKSLGQMLKKKDFSYLLNDLNNMVGTQEFNDLKRITNENAISELDELLFNIPNYCCNEEGKIIPESLDVIDFCIKNGANPNSYMHNGENFFLRACAMKSDEVLKFIAKKEYPINYAHTDGRCNNALYYAVMADSVKNIDHLVNNLGFNPNEKNIISEEQTVLHYACGHALINSMNTLIELGADIQIKDSSGRTPYDMMAFIKDEIVREEYSDEPETLEKWDKAHNIATEIYKKEVLAPKSRRLKKQY